MRAFLMCYLVAFSALAAAYPTTYEFFGHIGNYQYQGTQFQPHKGESISGTFTYELEQLEAYSLSSQVAPTLLGWEINVGAERYFQQLTSPLTQSILCCANNRLSFFDEMPGNTANAAFFDQGGFSFQFSRLDFLSDSLPVDLFLSGQFFWGGGVGATNSSASFSGVIEGLKVKVPETPAIFMILWGGVAAYVVRRLKEYRSLLQASRC